MEEKYSALIKYGIDQITQALTNEKPNQPVDVNWDIYESALGDQNSTRQLKSVLSLIKLENQIQKSPVYYHLQLLSSDSVMKIDNDADEWKGDGGQMYSLLKDELAYLENLHQDDIVHFQSFYHLYRKYAWAIPGYYGGEGVSLFEQWKAIAGMVLASGEDWKNGPNGEFSLVGGDIPGIQDFVYTITSKGAAKGLRGRSFFIQLLGEAVIHRILAELNLQNVNIIYAAGGNFMLLAPRLEEMRNNKSVADILRDVQGDIEKSLLTEFNGDLGLSLAWIPLFTKDIGTHSFSNEASRSLKEKIALGKRSRFSSIALSNWQELFSPQGKMGNRYCPICQIPLAKGEGVAVGQDVVGTQEPVRVCNACNSFGELARSLGKAQYLSIGTQQLGKLENWQKVLFKVSKSWFALERGGELNYVLNDTDFIKNGSQGFRFFANVTPHVTSEDRDNWNAEEEDERKPDIGDVRTFSQIASSAIGVENIGVLRMDVDNLGLVMVKGLEHRTMAATSALSSMLDQFFSGYLNNICREIDKERGESLYIIYAGGDDLFFIGAWGLMTPLAERIRTDFAHCTGDNPSLTISGAVTLEGKKFPLYQAAERAGGAEEKAKAYKRNNIEKDAFHFLGMEMGWEEWPQVISCYKEIRTALDGGASKSLMQILQNIYSQYDEQINSQKATIGPWIWRGAYALSRMAGRNDEIKEAISRLSKNSLDPERIRYTGLAARWMELLYRKEN